MTREEAAIEPADERSGSKAGFLAGLLVFAILIGLSVVGVGHARTLEGAANLQYWIVVIIVALAQAFITVALHRVRARTGLGERLRRLGVALAALWLAVFIWETLAIGTGDFAGPFEILWSEWKFIRSTKG